MSTAPLDLEAVKRVIGRHEMLKNCGGVVAAGLFGECPAIGSVFFHCLFAPFGY